MIVALDGQPVRTVSDLLRLLDRHKAGEQVRLEMVRDGQSREVPVTLAVIERRTEAAMRKLVLKMSISLDGFVSGVQRRIALGTGRASRRQRRS